MPNQKIEFLLKKRGFSYIAGVDEAGRGPLAGPVVAAAIILPFNHKIKGIDDSKKLSPNKRVSLFEILQKEAISIGVGIVDAKTIDKINILRASLLAMKLAAESLNPAPKFLLIDGNYGIQTDIPQKYIIKGDLKCTSIAAAGIIAKVLRDKMMEEYDKSFPHYGFKLHKGYGTKKHIDKILQFGACEIHRQSFDPVKHFFTT